MRRSKPSSALNPLCHSQSLCWVFLALAAAALAGCGGEQRGQVTGKVLYNDEPLTRGRVMFQPEKGKAARGEIGAGGEFTLFTEQAGDGVAVGSQSVRIISRDEPPTPTSGSGEDKEMPAGESLIPGKYGSYGLSGIQVEVTPGKNEFIFRLTDTAATVEKVGG